MEPWTLPVVIEEAILENNLILLRWIGNPTICNNTPVSHKKICIRVFISMLSVGARIWDHLESIPNWT